MRNACFTLPSLTRHLTTRSLLKSSLLAPLIVSGALVGGGCRQTTGPTATGQLSPMGTLSPVAPGQSPILGPFGGSTRVSPPPTGAFNGNSASNVAPNNYMGSAAPNASFGGLASAPIDMPPPSTDSFDQSPMGPPSFNSVAPIGSGVQTAAWTETNSNFPAAAPTWRPETLASRSQSSNQRDPRAGGMQVLDLTGAPNPPGYQPIVGMQSYASNNVQYQPSPIASPSMMQPQNMMPSNQVGVSQIAQSSFTPMPSTTPQFQSRGVDSRGPVGYAPAPFDAQAGISSSVSPGARIAEQTQTINSAPGSSPNLNWRRPGTQY